jgi:LacI family transcriptional regulator
LIVSVAKQTFEKRNFEHFNRLIRKNFPIVFFDRAPQDLPVSKVIIDDIEGGYNATKHLIEKGAKNIAILTTPPHISVGADREKGYRKALKESNLTADKKLILRIDERQPVKMQIEKLFDKKPVPDAVFAVNEQYAAIALKLALERNIKIPDDLMIIGFTDGLISKAITPSLSTMAQHGFEMGEKAMDILLEKIEDGEVFNEQKTVVIPINLVERESTKK